MEGLVCALPEWDALLPARTKFDKKNKDSAIFQVDNFQEQMCNGEVMRWNLNEGKGGIATAVIIRFKDARKIDESMVAASQKSRGISSLAGLNMRVFACCSCSKFFYTAAGQVRQRWNHKLKCGICSFY